MTALSLLREWRIAEKGYPQKKHFQIYRHIVSLSLSAKIFIRRNLSRGT